ncbi:MAG: PQQ-binding-like beta-propeller repeat protein [Actinomycetota bacterium]
MTRSRTARTFPALLVLTALLVGVAPAALAGQRGGDPSVLGTTGEELWVQRYDGGLENDDRAAAVETSIDGSVVFVTGWSTVLPGTADYLTIAYDTATGAEMWKATYDGIAGPGSQDSDEATAIGISPDGSAVFVTGNSRGEPTRNLDYATVAYDATTGDELWASRFGLKRDDVARGLEVSPDGSAVFVTGRSQSSTTGRDFATVAYDAVTGDEIWVDRYDGPNTGGDKATALGTSPDGSALFVTGESRGASSHRDYTTVAYDPDTGDRLWVRRFDGPDGLRDHARALEVSPDGSAVVITGFTKRSSGVADLDIATVALDAASGSRLWSAVQAGATGGTDVGNAVDFSADGSTVFVGGHRTNDGDVDYVTLAYDAAVGSRLWVRGYAGPGGEFDQINALEADPTGAAVYVTGQSDGSAQGFEYATIAYDGISGTRLWVRRYTGPVSGGPNDVAVDLAVDPAGTGVFVTGWSDGFPTFSDFATVAYSAA